MSRSTQNPNSNANKLASPSNSRRGAKAGTSRQSVTLIPRKSRDLRSSTTETPILTGSPKRPESNHNTREKKRPSSGIFGSIFLYLLRLAIMGVGISAIAGSVLAFFNPPTPIANSTPPQPETTQAKVIQPEKVATAVTFTQQLTTLKTRIQGLVSKNPKLKAEAFFVDLDNGNYVDMGGETPIAAASTIKVPVLVAFFQAVDAGKIHLDEMLTMEKDVMASGSGEMQYQQAGKKFTALETATKMIIISDNTATNMLIKRLGGKEVLNKSFQEWGLNYTAIHNPLPDLKGTNTTTPKDLSTLLARVHQGELMSMKSRDRMLDIMTRTHNRSLLPQGLEKEAVISHKTGDIGTVVGDAGIIDMPNGKRYIGTVFVKRPYNDHEGSVLIQDISKIAYQYFKWYQAKPSVKAAETKVTKEVKKAEKPKTQEL